MAAKGSPFVYARLRALSDFVGGTSVPIRFPTRCAWWPERETPAGERRSA